MKIESMNDLYVSELRDLYSAENQITKALPKMAKLASSQELRDAFREHLEQTRVHAERLEQILTKMGAKTRGKKCKGMEGLLTEGEELAGEGEEGPVLDAGLISAAQKVEHYEIASYGCVRTYAQMLGDEEAANLLQQTLDEEAETDKKLTALAEKVINAEAVETAE